MVPLGNEGDARAVTGPLPWVSRRVPLPVVLFLVVLTAAATFLFTTRSDRPLDTSADVGFLRDMSAHHAQAVEMALIIYDKTEDPKLKTVAYDMAVTQQGQIGRMDGWLAAWDLPMRSNQPPMAWMAGHDHGGGGSGEVPDRMPGLATDEQMAQLREATGLEAEVLFLELMIEHHRGGVDMAEAAVRFATDEKVISLAQGMIDAQASEIDLMNEMLVERGAEPLE